MQTATPVSTLPAAGLGEYFLVSAVFQRCLGLVYFIAFFSLSSQITGLAGEHGILPLGPWLETLLAEQGWRAFLHTPNVFWLNHSDGALLTAAWTGCGASLLLMLGVNHRALLALLFVLYLSLVHAGQTFMHFQWDSLLLEAGFLAIFLRPDSRVMVFLMRWLLFRLRFMSGLSKLSMGDPAWLGLTALTYYFETQPLPHAGAWYFHQLPEMLLVAATLVVLVVEIVMPWMMFMQRRWRFIAAWATLALQVLIMLSSNHNWFNLLSIALVLFLFDDAALRRVLPAGVCNRLLADDQRGLVQQASSLEIGLSRGLLVVCVVAGLFSTLRMATDVRLPDSLGYSLDVLQQWRIVNTYHVFPTMTRRQIELKVEGSLDGVNWQQYRFRYRPDRLDQRPQLVLPHHPRLDWMVWFVPLHPRFLDWFDAFLVALLENRPDVVALLAHNPFADQPPRMLRVRAWDYRFSTADERADSGRWWQRTDLGPFRPLPGKWRPSNPDVASGEFRP
jgi:hypothetical protein